tara:strand:+ start:911 stop:1561 length:651 start_codon:yes stop_codon:yes gene_type:complete
MNFFDLIFTNKSILRIFQIEKFQKENISGECIEFGADDNLKKNFIKPFSKDCKITYSNLNPNNKDIINIDLEKNLFHEKTYDYVIVFNVLEHLSDYKKAFKNFKDLLKKEGKIIGSTPFLFRVHGAPKDYVRFTNQYLEKILKENNFQEIKIEELGTGPFLSSISLLRSYLKYIPIFYQTLLIIAVMIDKLLKLLIKTDPKKIYPVGYIFSAKKID